MHSYAGTPADWRLYSDRNFAAIRLGRRLGNPCDLGLQVESARQNSDQDQPSHHHYDCGQRLRISLPVERRGERRRDTKITLAKGYKNVESRSL